MKKIEIAYEILSESRRNFEKYAATGRDFDLVQAHMYSIFECYAHGLINWRTVEKQFQKSLKEYVKLYKDDKQLMLQEKARMLDEYTRVLEEYKPALDEYKRVHEQKMTSNIVVKKQISESVAQEQSNFYFNKRALKEADLKDITRLKTWKRVVENYPNLTAKDEQRVRMLTIFEGPTIDTTQLITTVVTEYGNKKKKKVDEGSIAKASTEQLKRIVRQAEDEQVSAAFASQVKMARAELKKRGVSLRDLAKEAAPASSMRPQPRPSNLRSTVNIGSVSPSGGTRGIDPRLNYSPADAARLTGQPTPPAGTPRAPVSSPRPQQRPDRLGQRAAINRAVRTAMGEGAAEDYIVANAKERMADLEPEAREAFLAQLEKSYPGIRQKIGEGYKVLPPMDREKYQERPGLEGPFSTLSGKVVYYDPKEGAYYDPDTDMYLSYDEFQQLDKDYSGMKDERDIAIREGSGDTYAVVSYNYSDDWGSIEIVKDGETVEEWNDYFGANETGNPLAAKFVELTKKHGIDPTEIDILSGDDEDIHPIRGRKMGRFDGRKFKWNTNEAVAKIACLKCDEVSTAKAWEKNRGFCPKCKTSNQGVAESDDTRMGSITVTSDEERKRRAQAYRDKKAKEKESKTDEGLGHIGAIQGMMRKEKSAAGRSSVTLDYSRYMRSHGKKPRDTGDAGLWMFTTTDYGDPSAEDTFEFSGRFADAKRAAAKWAKSQGADRVYVMEAMSDAEVDAFHRDLDKLVHKHIGHGSHEKDDVDERKMTKKEKSKEKRLKDKYDDSGMKQSMKDQYGDDWEEVYFATIRKKAMEQFNEMTSAGGIAAVNGGNIAAVAQPLGKMQRRNKKTNESEMMTEEQFDEAAGEKDACYHKVKSRYKVWPSAYASGALVQCRKVGAKNWGNKSK